MKRVYALMALMILLVGALPAALADDDEEYQGRGVAVAKLRAEHREKLQQLDQGYQERLSQLRYEHVRKVAGLEEGQLLNAAGLSDEEFEKLALLDRSRLREYADKEPAELREALQRVTVKRVAREDAFRKRVLSESEAEGARNRYEHAARNYEQAKRLFEERKRSWEDAVTAGNETAAVAYAKEYLGHAADMVIQSLEKVRAGIEGDDDLTDEEVEEALEEIDEKIAEMEAAKESLEAAETKEEVKAAGEGILAAWEGMRLRLKVHAELVVRTQVGDVLSRSEALERHLERVLAEMEDEGVDVEDLDEKLDDFSALIGSARDKLSSSQVLFAQAKEDGDRDALDEAKELARDAHDDLKEAHSILMVIVREVKAEGYDVEDDGEYVEVVEVDDDEQVVCCMAATAECMACAEGVSVEEFCEGNPGVDGCEDYDDDDGVDDAGEEDS